MKEDGGEKQGMQTYELAISKARVAGSFVKVTIQILSIIPQFILYKKYILNNKIDNIL